MATHIVKSYTGQVVVNYSTSAAAAEEVANQIKERGGDAIVIGADMCKSEDMNRQASLRCLNKSCSRTMPQMFLQSCRQ